MKKVVAFRLDPELLERVRCTAKAENRTLTNFVETVLKRALAVSDRDRSRTSSVSATPEPTEHLNR